MIILSRRAGRMGNRLFSFAHYMANSVEHGPYNVLNPAFNEYSAYFTGPDSQWVTHFSPQEPQEPAETWKASALRRTFRKLMDTLLYSLSNPFRSDRIAFLSSPFHEVIDLHAPAVYPWRQTGFLKFVQRKIVISNGWVFWDHESFLKHAQKIREYFRLVPALEDNVRQHVGQCRAEGVTLVGVHVRHGDYHTAVGGKYFYETADYAELMRRVARTAGGPVRFLVCSDARIHPEDYAGLDIRTGPGTAIEDMYSLAACDYIMGPPSSFSGWASFYGQVPLYFIEEFDQALAEIELPKFVTMNSFDPRDASHRYLGGRERTGL